MKALIKLADVVAIITQVAGIAVPMAVHAMELGEYKWLVSDAPKVSPDKSYWKHGWVWSDPKYYQIIEDNNHLYSLPYNPRYRDVLCSGG